MEEAVRLYQHHVAKYLLPTRDALDRLGKHEDLFPHIEFAVTHIRRHGRGEFRIAGDTLEVRRRQLSADRGGGAEYLAPSLPSRRKRIHAAEGSAGAF